MTNYFERLSQLERSRSLSAVWCQRLAVFAIPYLTIVILGHRTGVTDTVSTFWLLGLGVLILIAAMVAGGHGFFELWTYGYQAGLSATRGMLLAILLLLPFLYQAVQAFVLPPLYDISTDLEDPPTFDTVLADRTDQMNPVIDPGRTARRLQLQSYPRVAARRYPLGTARVFKEVVTLISERDWVIYTADTEQGKASIDDEGSGLIAKPVTDAAGRPLRLPLPKPRPNRSNSGAPSANSAAFELVQVSPIGREPAEEGEEQDERYIEAVATSFLFGFQSDVVIRMIEEEEGTLVDMRSTSRWGPHDLGSNASRIISFMEDLDTALQGLSQ